MVVGCTNDALNYLGVRLRKPSTRAVWAPDLDAFLCKEHAEAGGMFGITFEPGSGGMVTFTVRAGGQLVTERTIEIKRSAA